ncbi:tryptophan synthase alpha chain [Larkinella arboricola]|uniref:Tryptophan synthase alpha chain n=1 Tax=Larkinella arboricola TaxID=643671 RepID=A0A327WHL2_LARAB|nr:tryptophan synthase subunit alpha [Larkinella arboricola]RAJ89768.1 tryptophan synthase alpha chain [Larkinella arboricola]
MNRIAELFQHKSEQVLNVYFTAGFPQLNDTVPILETLEQAGVDIIEIGMPYSDPVADGETIQQSNQKALNNGMTLRILFDQLQGIREKVQTPILLMGYLNPVVQFGVEAFCQKCAEVGVDGIIVPDLPIDVYERDYKPTFDQYNLLNIFLITPQTSEDRIRQIDQLSDGFIYMVSSASTTGSQKGITDEMKAYFSRIKAMNIGNPRLIGFGIQDYSTFETASQYANGAIIGSAFVRLLERNQDNLTAAIHNFIRSIRDSAPEEKIISEVTA